LSEIGIEGGSLTKMQGLIREARDLQGIRKDVASKDSSVPKDTPPAAPEAGGGTKPTKKG
jgi:hypothetical protein